VEVEEKRAALLAAFGRLHLQLGNIKKADKVGSSLLSCNYSCLCGYLFFKVFETNFFRVEGPD
jgi:hypothetical protein